jgi:diguanylate cyclase (GGDEF)-like protein/PAS domain S-box-containing protein
VLGTRRSPQMEGALLAGSSILIVEDDGIIGRHIQITLERLGYVVIGILDSGEKAIAFSNDRLIDLVLMDVSLKGAMDGTEAARVIHDKHDIPVIFLTAYVDDGTIAKAKKASPYGYLFKPFNEGSLAVTIEMALHRHSLEKQVRQSEELFRTLVLSQGEGTGIMDEHEIFTFTNPVAEEIFGVPPGMLVGRSIREFTTDEQYARILTQTESRRQGERSSYDLEITKLDGSICYLVVTATPRYDKKGNYIGAFGIFRDMTEKTRMEQEEKSRRLLLEALGKTAKALTSNLDQDVILDQILSNIGQIIPYGGMNIILFDGPIAHIVRWYGYDQHHRPSNQIEIIEIAKVPNFQKVIETKKVIQIPDTSQDPSWVDISEADWLRSYLGAPIIIRDQVIGLINIDHPTPNFYTALHIQVLEEFASQVAIAMQNARLYEEARLRAEYLALVNDITHQSLAANNAEELLHNLAESLGKMVGGDGIYITLWEEEGRRAIPAAAYGLASDVYRSEPVGDNETTLTSSALDAGKPLVVEDIQKSEYVDPNLVKTYPLRSALVLPMISGGTRLGAVIIGYKANHHYENDEIVRAEQIASQVALALEKIRLFDAEHMRTEELGRANHLITALTHVSSRIEVAHDPDSVLETLGNELIKLNIRCLVTLYDPENENVTIRYPFMSPRRSEMLAERLGVDLFAVKNVIERSPAFNILVKQRQPLYVRDLYAEIVPLFFAGVPEGLTKAILRFERVSENSHGIHLPLVVEGKVTGFLWLWGSHMEEKDLPVMSIFASQVAIIIEHSRLYAEVQKMAITDEVTRLYNRRGLFELTKREIDRARRFNRPVSLMMLDIDFFKKVNDQYGHPVGDEVLACLAEHFIKIVREIDIVGRYGGEEFVIVLPETDLRSASGVAERIRKSIEEHKFHTRAGDVAITISIGLTWTSRGQLDLDQMLDLADQALYQAKNTGRNRSAVKDPK